MRRGFCYLRHRTLNAGESQRRYRNSHVTLLDSDPFHIIRSKIRFGFEGFCLRVSASSGP